MVTVSGYVIHLLGKVPERGALLRIGAWQGAVEAVDGIKVKTLRITRPGEPEVEEE